MTLPALLFAAGFGTRMGALTADRPKPMIPVAGRALIDHALDLLDDAGITRRVANLHYRAAQLADHLGPKGVLLSHEEPDILETGGGLRQALPLLGPGPVITLNTDAAWTGENPVTRLLQAWDPDRMDALLLCLRPGQALGHAGGDFAADAAGRLTRGGPLVYSGLQIIKPEGLHAIPDRAFSLNRLWDRMIAENRLYSCGFDGRWCDVGRPETIPIAEAMLRGGADD